MTLVSISVWKSSSSIARNLGLKFSTLRRPKVGILSGSATSSEEDPSSLVVTLAFLRRRFSFLFFFLFPDGETGPTVRQSYGKSVIFGVKYCISVYYTDWTTTFQEFYSPNPCGAPLRAVVPGVPPRHLQTSPTIEKQQQHTKRKTWPWIITSTISTRMNATCPISGKGPGHMSVAPRWVDECISKSTSRNQPLVPQFQHTLPYILLQSNKTQKSISLIHGLFSKYLKK